MKYLNLVNIIYIENRFWVKYATLNAKSQSVINSVSFRTLEEAKEFYKQIKNKIK